MSFMPVIIMNLILLVITALLIIADKLLVNYGQCKIVVEKDGEETTYKVEGGQNLMSYLIDAGIEISSSCGGKGTCGYCKVQVPDGGGPILPTEEIFMSRAEKERDMRLACQVKVKNDVRIQIPN
ncbi:MAG: 2Fe-2S iron-sulfur cluster binding domain-containing protein, partial [Spirochaetales bacterium]|nr:2Fe-2S iron-sulfur cluster binding domain-containing protein [Spirochaetales bacterium]